MLKPLGGAALALAMLTAPAIAQADVGFDAASYQGCYNAQAAVQAGARFSFIKLSEGTDYVNLYAGCQRFTAVQGAFPAPLTPSLAQGQQNIHIRPKRRKKSRPSFRPRWSKWVPGPAKSKTRAAPSSAWCNRYSRSMN